jgi:hypothetical protein
MGVDIYFFYDHILEWSSEFDSSVIDNWKIKRTFDVVNDVNQDFFKIFKQ